MSEDTSDIVWLTQEAFDKLTDELEYLRTEGRAQVSAKIGAAREEGDLSENGGYHAAKEEQGHMEARIRQLVDMLDRAQVGTAGASSSEVAPGRLITIAFNGDESDTDTFLLGSREVLGLDDSVDVSVYSPQSPLGAAVLGKQKGEDASYVAPNGKTILVKIMNVEAFG